MKTLVGFRYWITGIIVVVIGIVFVAHKQHDAAEKYKRHRAEYCSALGSTPQQKKECIEKRTSARDYLPWGYDLVRWPEGITTWAILLTLGAIGWQGWETRKVAEATRDSICTQVKALRIAINTERPYLVISVESPTPDAFVFMAKNEGSTPAKIKSIWNKPILVPTGETLRVPERDETNESLSLLQKSEHSVIYEAGMADFRIGLSLPIPK